MIRPLGQAPLASGAFCRGLHSVWTIHKRSDSTLNPSHFKLIASDYRQERFSGIVVARGAGAPIPPLQGWAVLTGLAVCGAGGQLLERYTRVGVYLSAPLLAILLSLSAASLGLMPHGACPMYDVVWTYLMPMAVALYLLESDMTLLLKTAGQSIIAFFNGAIGTIAGTLVAYVMLGKFLGPFGSSLAAALCASYIGGSINFAAVSKVMGLTQQGSMLAAAMTADNLAMALYITVLMAIPAPYEIRQDKKESNLQQTAELPGEEVRIRPEMVSISFAAALVACALGESVAVRWPGFKGGGLALTACAASGLGILGGWVSRRLNETNSQLNKPTFSPFGGSGALGTMLMMVFFATIGAVAGNFSSLFKSGWLLGFIAIQLAVQLAVSLLLGRVMNIPMPVILVAANANVGGSATAAAMASAKGWTSLVQAAILTGVLGYTIATPIGCIMATVLAGCPTMA